MYCDGSLHEKPEDLELVFFGWEFMFVILMSIFGVHFDVALGWRRNTADDVDDEVSQRQHGRHHQPSIHGERTEQKLGRIWRGDRQ